MKKQRTILIVIICTGIFITIIGFFLRRHSDNIKNINNNKTSETISYPKENEGSVDINPMNIDNTTTANLVNIFDEYGLKFKYPEGWTYRINFNEECKSSTPGSKFCIRIVDPSGGSFIEFKAEENETGLEGGGLIKLSDYEKGKLIALKKDNLDLFRMDKINGIYDYENKNIIDVTFIEEIYDTYQNIGYIGDVVGSDKIWYYKNNKSYTLTYFLDPSIIPDRYNIGENTLVNQMDQILSTIEIDFTIDPFTN